MSGPILLIVRILMVIILYTFLGWALFTLWQDLRSQEKRKVQRIIPHVKIIPESDVMAAPFHFSSSEIIIGRDSACDLSIEDPTISSRHARLYFRQDQWWLEDLGSTNGTYLNDMLLSLPTVITGADHLRIGQLLYTIQVEENP